MGANKEKSISLFEECAEIARKHNEIAMRMQDENWQQYEEDMKQRDKEIEEKLWRLDQLIDEHTSGADYQVGKALINFITDNIRKHAGP